MATEIPQKHIPLMRKLLTAEIVQFNANKLLAAYKIPDDRLLTDAGMPLGAQRKLKGKAQTSLAKRLG